MNFKEAMSHLLTGKRVKRKDWKWYIKLGGVQASNPRKDRIQFGYPIINDNTAGNHYDFDLEDLMAHDWVVESED